MKHDEKYFDVPLINSIQDMIIRSSSEYSAKLALADLSQTPLPKVSYAEILDYILRFGAALRHLGIKERTHIAVIGENRVQWAISFLTGMCFNYVMVPIDKNLTSNEILNILHESESEVIIFSGSFAGLIADYRTSLRKLKFFISMDETGGNDGSLQMTELIYKSKKPALSELPAINPDEMAELIFTSGSLGRAKGVMLSQRNLASNLMDMVSMVML